MEIKNDLDIKDEDLKQEDFTAEELESSDVDWKAKAQELLGNAKRRATQLSKAKAKFGEYEKELNELRPLKISPKPSTVDPNFNKPSEPDYGRLAYLQSRGITHPDDQKIAQDEADRLKLPLTDVLEMEHIKAKLRTSTETREAQEGMPRGGNRSGGTTQHDVAHWVDKRGSDGQFETPDDQELAEKVIDARMKKESSNKFSDSLYTG